MRSYGNSDGRQVAGARRAIRRQAKLPAEEIGQADFARLLRQAELATARNKRQIEAGETFRSRKPKEWRLG